MEPLFFFLSANQPISVCEYIDSLIRNCQSQVARHATHARRFAFFNNKNKNNNKSNNRRHDPVAKTPLPPPCCTLYTVLFGADAVIIHQSTNQCAVKHGFWHEASPTPNQGVTVAQVVCVGRGEGGGSHEIKSALSARSSRRQNPW